MKDKIKIIIVDDDALYLEMLKEFLNEYKPVGITSSKEALKRIKEEKFDLLILDYYVDELNGKEIVKKIREFDQDLYILILTGFGDNFLGKDLLVSSNIQNYVEKTTQIEDKIIIQIMSGIKSVEHMKLRNSVDFATRLKELRTTYNISQEDLAEFIKVKRTQISNYEVGISKPSVEILEKIADYFGVSLDYLLCRSINYPDTLRKKN